MKQRGTSSRHQLLHRINRRAIPAHQPVPPQDPHVAFNGDGLLWHFWNRVLVGQTLWNFLGEQRLNFVNVKAGQGQVKALGLQVAYLNSQQFLIPTGVEGHAVVSDDVGAALGFGQVGGFDAGQAFHA